MDRIFEGDLLIIPMGDDVLVWKWGEELRVGQQLNPGEVDQLSP